MASIAEITHLCSECKACQNICAKDAIEMDQNTDGFAYPLVNTENCIDCGLCVKVCPMINANDLKHSVQHVFAAQLKDKKILQRSSSGGVFSMIATYVLECKGIIFGAAWDEHLQLHHIGVDTIEDLARLRGSKYVHSDIGNTYVEARHNLQEGRLVYYTGTPCQIAGLKLFLHKDYPNLITSDLVCHGTPSQKIFNLFVNQMENERNVKIYDYLFRDKRIFGWSCSSSSFSMDNNTGGKRYHYYDKNMVAYFQAFIKGHITREDCYSCPFACPSRVSDVTLADYWDIKKHHIDFPNQHDGVSLIMVNSSKGEQIINILRNRVLLVDSTLEKALDTSNYNLKAPTPRPRERDHSYKDAFTNFIEFRNRYASFGKSEEFYRRAYLYRRIKEMPILRTILQLFGKA